MDLNLTQVLRPTLLVLNLGWSIFCLFILSEFSHSNIQLLVPVQINLTASVMVEVVQRECGVCTKPAVITSVPVWYLFEKKNVAPNAPSWNVISDQPRKKTLQTITTLNLPDCSYCKHVSHRISVKTYKTNTYINKCHTRATI